MADAWCPVNPKGGTIFGYESVTSIAAIDPPVDLAVIVIRPDAILDAAKEAADRGIRNLLILPGGFAEAGPIGVQRNEELTEACRGARPHGRRAELRRHHPSRSGLALRRHLPARPAARRRGGREQWPCLHLPVRRARRGDHRQGQCARPAAHLGRVGRQRRASRCRGLPRLAGRAAGDRRGAALHRIDRGPRTLPPRGARRGGPQTGDRPVRRPHRDRRAGGVSAYRRRRQRRRRDRRLLRFLRHRPGREPAPAAGRRQGVRPLPAGAGQPGADPVQFRRSGRAVRRPRLARGPGARRACRPPLPRFCASSCRRKPRSPTRSTFWPTPARIASASPSRRRWPMPPRPTT